MPPPAGKAVGVTELGAALQVIRQGVALMPRPSRPSSPSSAILPARDRQQLKQLGGIGVFDPEQLKQGREVMRSLPVLIEEIVTKSGGLSSKIG